jgi:hypothetical protein
MPNPRAGSFPSRCGFLALAFARGFFPFAVRLLLPVLYLPADQVGRLVDALLELAARDLVVVRRDVARLHGVHAQELHDVDTELLRGEVPCLLHCPVGGRVAEAAKGPGRNEIRVDEHRMSAYSGVLVERVVAHACRAENRLRFPGVGAVVGPYLDFLSHHAPVLAEAEPHPVAHRHARVAGEEFLLARVDQLDRPAGEAREKGANHRSIVIAGLAAESAADLGLDHAHLRFGRAERSRIAPAREERRLRVAPHRDAPAVPFRHAADGLERGVPLAHGFPGSLHDDIGSLEAGRHIAALEAELVRDVAGRIVVHEGRAGREGLVKREHCGQHLVAHLDLVYGRAGRLRVHGRNGCHLIPDVAHLVDGEGIEIRTERAPFPFRGVAPGRDRLDARHRGGGTRVDGNDPGVRMGTSQHRGVQHAREMQIGDVLRRAGDFRHRIGAWNVLAYDQQAGGGGQPGIARGHVFLVLASAMASR